MTGEFALDSLPASDRNGNIMLVAKIEDNDQYGNLSVEKTVPWGVFHRNENRMDRRSLWATGDKAPVWLLLMAFSIIAGVWGVIVYLVIKIIQIRKIGIRENVSKRNKMVETVS